MNFHLTVPDANILLYAYNSDAPDHDKARRYLEAKLSGTETFGLSWQIITAFLRISTNVRAFPNPLAPNEAAEIVSEWLERPNVQILLPTEKHWAIFKKLIADNQIKAALIMDAHLAALAVEYDAILATTDGDFARFANLKIINPLQL